MLEITEETLTEIKRVFLSQKEETGFLLGSASRLNRLEHCCQLPAKQAGMYFYTPDENAADEIIRKWSEQGICFCGMIHSHLVPKENLSDHDIEYAKMIFQAFSLPVLWFGIGVMSSDSAKFHFYSINETTGNKIQIEEVLLNEDGG